MADITLIKNVTDWADDATAILKSFDPRTFHWLNDPDGPPYEIGWVGQEGVVEIPQMFPTFPNTGLLITDARQMVVYLHKSTLEIDTRLIAVEAVVNPPIPIIIPSWNMKATPMISVPHAFGAKENIAAVDGRIRDDTDTYLWQFTDDDGGFMYWDDTDIYLNRAANTKFNSNDFNGSGFDRGIIYVTLAP